MATDTKQIELSDILALRFECNRCKSVLSISPEVYSTVVEEERRQRDMPVFFLRCPVCRNEWGAYQHPLTTFVNELRNATSRMREFKDEREKQNKEKEGFSLTLEIRDEETEHE